MAKNKNNGDESSENVPLKNDRTRLKDLFHAWEAVDKERTELEAKLDALKMKSSDAVKAILDCAGKVGPFGYKGDELTIITRGPTDKNPDARTIYYFRGKRKEQEVTQIG